MMAFRNAFDNWFDRSFPFGDWDTDFSSQIPLDIVEDEDGFEVKAVLPGINPDELDVTFSNNTLTIRGETSQDDEKEGTRYHLRERRYGSFTRSVTIPTNIKAEDIQANYDAGILTPAPAKN